MRAESEIQHSNSDRKQKKEEQAIERKKDGKAKIVIEESGARFSEQKRRAPRGQGEQQSEGSKATSTREHNKEEDEE